MYETLPKVVLHDHLDGGLRPATVVELAAEVGHRLPETDPERLAAWFDQSGSGSLERYLEAFTHTVAVMQTPDALTRVAREAVEDLAADGVVYAEIRFAPSLHMRRGLDRVAVIEAVAAGLREAEDATGTPARIIVDAMRQDDDSVEVAEAAVRCRDLGVVGFDLAGPERGFPPERHAAALRIAREGGLRLTIHAGEGDGPHSIWRAMARGCAERIGHGVRIIEDCVVEDGEVVALGDLARQVRDRRLPLEVCIKSNLDTMNLPPRAHPVGALHRAGFTITLNTDNRLMSRTSMSTEFALAVRHHGFTLTDLERVTTQAVHAAFCDLDLRERVLGVVSAGYAAATAID